MSKAGERATVARAAVYTVGRKMNRSKWSKV